MSRFLKLQAESSQRINKLPTLYQNQSFWFPQEALWFCLKKANLTPQDCYDLDFFLWDPECLLPDGIQCPNKNCTAKLWQHGNIPYPRRVVDISHTFWIIGYRYLCPTCRNSSSDPWPQSTFQSWDEHIINQLPKPLAAEFPVHLTQRSAISKKTFQFMCSCFQNGMGAKQFSNSLLIQHLEGYDELQLAYLQTVATRPARNAVTGEPLPKFIPFPPFHDRSQDGFHGYIPSSQWLHDIFDSFIENHTAAFNQHMAMLTGNVCAIDHSFKLAKHIAKVNGVPVFTALLTVTNEKGEIRICNLVATKSHSQFELALQRMRDSLQLYGHDQPSLFYTDNMSDKAFLEHSFPSLTADVVPVEKYAHLDLLKIHDTVNISVRNSIETIDTAMRTILSFLPDDDSMETIIVGFDAEWNVEISERGYITGRGQTAIIQIAHQQNVYILQIGEMLARGSLPPVLKELLQNPQIIKVGCRVSADLKYIEQSLHSACHFSGSLDLARYAKDRQAIKSARCGLSDLVATVLGKQLQKNVSERVGSSWDNHALSPEQIQYAALDA
ncbi:ribonuclease H-like protein [Gymnopus androsaceus JB14]|uniref:Ribonuclease H-like protein n=1 Tax=Gymnopus androsaceus JB14 TaxID=1447944 RepID=A0A6A4GYQ1_9AGAR|nr:ribonuclease H-like protein [Gymnopus androsaceus JB14]